MYRPKKTKNKTTLKPQTTEKIPLPRELKKTYPLSTAQYELIFQRDWAG